MGILDEAIREHLELKRKRGAEQDELRQLEDEAFGPATRAGDQEDSETVDEGTGLGTDAEAGEASSEEETTLLGLPPEGDQAEPVDEAPEPLGQTTREQIAQQPTEVFDVAGELARQIPEDENDVDVEGTEATPEAEEPSEAQAPSGPAAAEGEPEEVPPAESPTEPEAISAPAEQEAPPEPEAVPEAEQQHETEAESEAEPPESDAGPELFDEQALSEELEQALEGPTSAESRRAAFFEETDEFQAPTQRPARPADPSPDTSEEDVLGETPDFLEETPEHDRLWFEQKPPKDFDFND